MSDSPVKFITTFITVIIRKDTHYSTLLSLLQFTVKCQNYYPVTFYQTKLEEPFLYGPVIRPVTWSCFFIETEGIGPNSEKQPHFLKHVGILLCACAASSGFMLHSFTQTQNPSATHSSIYMEALQQNVLYMCFTCGMLILRLVFIHFKCIFTLPLTHTHTACGRHPQRCETSCIPHAYVTPSPPPPADHSSLYPLLQKKSTPSLLSISLKSARWVPSAIQHDFVTLQASKERVSAMRSGCSASHLCWRFYVSKNWITNLHFLWQHRSWNVKPCYHPALLISERENSIKGKQLQTIYLLFKW